MGSRRLDIRYEVCARPTSPMPERCVYVCVFLARRWWYSLHSYIFHNSRSDVYISSFAAKHIERARDWSPHLHGTELRYGVGRSFHLAGRRDNSNWRRILMREVDTRDSRITPHRLQCDSQKITAYDGDACHPSLGVRCRPKQIVWK